MRGIKMMHYIYFGLYKDSFVSRMTNRGMIIAKKLLNQDNGLLRYDDGVYCRIQYYAK